VLLVPGMLMVHRVFVRQAGLVVLIRRRGGLTREAQNSEEETLNPVQRSAHLRPLRFNLMTVGDANLVGLIRVPHPQPSHAPKTTENEATFGENGATLATKIPTGEVISVPPESKVTASRPRRHVHRNVTRALGIPRLVRFIGSTQVGSIRRPTFG
jgi:hypothetical protein